MIVRRPTSITGQFRCSSSSLDIVCLCTSGAGLWAAPGAEPLVKEPESEAETESILLLGQSNNGQNL